MTDTTANTTEITSEPTFVRHDRIEGLTKLIEKLAKRAAKLGVAAPSIALTGAEKVRTKRLPSGRDLDVLYREVVVTGETPKLPGWDLIAIVDHTDDVVDVVPGKSCPPDQRQRGPVCDHCGRKDNRRKKTMVLRNDDDDSVVQVGTTCIGDFLGRFDRDPQAALAYASQVLDLIGDISGMGNEDLNGSDGGYGGGYVDPDALVANCDVVLLWTAGWLVDNPWISGGKAWDTHSTPTKSYIADLIWPPTFTGPMAAKLQAEYRAERQRAQDAIDGREVEFTEEVTAALAWVIEAAAAEPENDYLAACATIAEKGYARRKRFGYLCSILPTYRRHVEKQRRAEEAEQRRAERLNEHFGVEGERIALDLRLVFDVKPIENDFGISYLHTFEDPQGRRFKLFSSNKIAEQAGTTLVAKATIKGHGEFRGDLETRLSRATVIAKGEGKELDAARSLIAGDVQGDADDPAFLGLGKHVRYMKRAGVWRLK